MDTVFTYEDHLLTYCLFPAVIVAQRLYYGIPIPVTSLADEEDLEQALALGED